MFVKVNRVAFIVSLIGMGATIFMPVLSEAPNRILPGEGRYLASYLPIAFLFFYLALWSFVFSWRGRACHILTLICSIIGFWSLCLVSGYYANHLLEQATPYARVGFSSGFWLSAILWLLMALDSMQNLKFSYLYTALCLFLVYTGLAFIVASGFWQNISLVKEYMVEKDVFWSELVQHIYLVFGATFLAILITIPLVLSSLKSKWMEDVIFSILNITQTIPSIALFGLLIAPLAWFALRFPVLKNIGVGGIGWAPAVIALTLYALLPICRNSFVAIKEIPKETIEAARAMGMTRNQIFIKVIFPLSLPLILTGVRSTVILLIGLTAVAGLIGAGGLGRFIFQGLGEQAIDKIMLGAIPTVALALLFDFIFNSLMHFILKKG